MMTLSQLRKKFRPASPVDILENLAQVCRDPATPPGYMPPVLTLVLKSGHTFKGYLVDSHSEKDSSKTFLFSLEIVNEGDGAADLCYVQGSAIEALTVWNVDDYHGILPRVEKSR
jgi:hypothetical protein